VSPCERSRTIGRCLAVVSRCDGTAAIQPGNLSLLVVWLALNGAGQGLVIPLAFNTILGAVRDEQAGMASGALSTLQTVGTSTGLAVVGVLLFSALGSAGLAVGRDSAILYGHALALATLYNIAAALASLILFTIATRR